MDIEILNEPISFRLFGLSSVVENHCYGEVGCRLLDEMWRIVHDQDSKTTGINHWVYLTDGSLFVGVELLNNSPGDLQPLEIELPRYLKHVHVGPYSKLPEKWNVLKEKLAERGESIGFPSLEIYGHHCDDESKLETTILICLKRK
jgi:hypothetical protein